MPPRKNYKKYTKKNRDYKLIKKIVQSQINKNVETKYLDTGFISQAISTTPSSYGISSLTQGTARDERTGDRVSCTGFYVSLTMTGADAYNQLRMVVYTPRDQDDSLTGLDLDTPIDKDLYQVHMDRSYITCSSGNNPIVRIREYQKYKGQGKPIFFDGATTTPTKNVFKVTFVSDSTAPTHPDLHGNIRWYFKDA